MTTVSYNDTFSLMTLKEWIKSVGKTQASFADELGLTRVTLNRIANGADPKPKTARDIITASGKTLTFNDLYGYDDIYE